MNPTVVVETERCSLAGCPVALDANRPGAGPTEHNDVCRMLSVPPRNPPVPPARPVAPPPIPPRSTDVRRPLSLPPSLSLPPPPSLPPPSLPPPSIPPRSSYARDASAAASAAATLAADRAAPLGRPAVAPGSEPLTLMFDSGIRWPGTPRVLLYTNAMCLRALSASRHWFADGSLPSAPNGSRQYAVYGVTECCENFRSLVQAFVTGWTAETYRRLFLAIKWLMPDDAPDPELLIVHMKNTERNAIAGARYVFPGVRVRACIAHTARVVWMMARRCRVPHRLLEIAEHRRHLERLLAIVLAEPAELPAWFDAVTAEPFYREHAAGLARFLGWFRQAYVGVDGGPPLFPVDVWNYYDAVVLRQPVAADPPHEFAADAVAVGLTRFLRHRRMSQQRLRSIAPPDCGAD